MLKRIFTLLTVLLAIHFSLYAQVSTLMADINPGKEGSFVNGNNLFLSFNGSLIFAAQNTSVGHEVFIYKDKQVKLLKDINPGIDDSEAQNFYLLNNKIVFTANTKTYGTELWISDGTTEGTKLLKDIAAGPVDGVLANSFSNKSFLIFKNKLYFSSFNGSNFLMWETDGTPQGTKQVENMNTDHRVPDNFTIFKDELYFTSSFKGVFKIENETNKVLNVIPSLSFYNLLATDKKLYCIEYESIWLSEGSSISSRKIADITSPTLNTGSNRIIELNQIVYFPNYTKDFGPELWRTDGTLAGTKIVKDAFPGTEGYAPQNFIIFKGKLYYKGENENSGIELFVSDGTEQGTKIVKDIKPGTFSSFSLPTTLISDYNRIYFNASSFFTDELWISDGSTAGTRKLKVTKDLDNEDDPRSFYLFDDKLIVFAASDELGFEPYIIEFIDNPLDLDKDGFVGSEDCDENNPKINAGATEIPYNGINDDCNTLTPDDDIDKDGFKRDVDCNDNDSEISPNESEKLYNGKDDDCNPKTVDDDFDGDGYLKKDDCDDTNKNINPKGKEILGNKIDENCDGKDDPLLGIEEDVNVILAYPNPSWGEFELKNVNLNSLEIYNSKGEKVPFFLENNKVKLKKVPPGIYLIQGKKENSEDSFSLKILILDSK